MPWQFDLGHRPAGPVKGVVGVLAMLATLHVDRGACLAQDASDPSHGRIEGDLGVVVGGGVAVAPRGPRVEGELRVRYLEVRNEVPILCHSCNPTSMTCSVAEDKA